MKEWRMTKGLSLEIDEWGIKSPLIYKREGESRSEGVRTGHSRRNEVGTLFIGGHLCGVGA